MPVAVFKLGGSLLTMPELPARWRAVRSAVSDHQPLLVCGGGEAANLVRRWHGVFTLDEERSHWLALEAIRLNQRLLLSLLPELELAASREAAELVWQRGRVPLLDLLAFLRVEESLPHGTAAATPLPHTWDVTSDSLAAWVAMRWPAQRLVLLKSAPWLSGAHENDWKVASASGLVDAYFPTLAPALPPTLWCDLRGDATPRKIQ